MPTFPTAVGEVFTDVFGTKTDKATFLGKIGSASAATVFSPGSDNVIDYDGPNYVFMSVGDDTFYSGGLGDDAIGGNEGNDSLYGGFGNDLIGGGPGADTISGGPGADELRGGRDNDSINGGSDADTLYGGVGDDTLSGGQDSIAYDVFGFFAANGGTDLITDFDPTGDKLLVSKGVTWTASTSAIGSAQVNLSTGQVIVLQGVAPVATISSDYFIFV